jgi:hypothetical protein
MQDNQREEVIYLAGLFDGEGTICIQKSEKLKDKDNGRNWNPVYNITFRIGMNDKNSIESYLKFFNVGYMDCEKIYHSYRPMWRYSARAKADVEYIIGIIGQFLRLKKPQAELALKFYKNCPRLRGRYTDPKVLKLMEEYYQQMRQLNGVDISSPATTKRSGRSPSVRVSDSLSS